MEYLYFLVGSLLFVNAALILSGKVKIDTDKSIPDRVSTCCYVVSVALFMFGLAFGFGG